jgi:probable rRNA maturation factor
LTDITNISSNTTFDVEKVERAVSETLIVHNSENSEVSVLLTDDPHMTQLNRKYREINAPTDVLAFAMQEGEDNNDLNANILGDVVISLETAERQAKEETHSLEEEVAFLTVHGVLHLLGYDHQSQNEVCVMFEKQNIILQRLQLKRSTK